jgi:hypothetical protein
MPTGTKYSLYLTPAPFQAPHFDRLQESSSDWKKKADALWERHRDAQIRVFDSWVKLGVDERIPEAKRPRGPGRKGRNVEPDARYEWAARRLKGDAWKEIAFVAGRPQDRVRKAAIAVLRIAGWEE